jgi:hypothetical protein
MAKKASSRSRLVKEAWSLYLDPEVAAALRKLSEKTRVPAQEYLREGVDLVLQRYKNELRKEPKR